MADVDEEFQDLIDVGVASTTESLQNRLVDAGVWQDTRVADTGTTFLENVSGGLVEAKFLALQMLQESMPSRARLLENVVEGYRSLLGFNPDRRVWSSTTLSFSVSSPLTRDVPIPRKTIVADAESDLTVLTAKDVILSAGQTSVEVEAVEGTLNSQSLTSQGSPDLEVHLDSSTIAENDVPQPIAGVEPFVDGDRWSVVDTLLRAIPENQDVEDAFGVAPFESVEIKSRSDLTLDVVFGDGANGRIPPEGSTVRVDYIETEGPDGTIFESDRLTQIQSTVRDINGNDVTDQLSVTNTANLEGGSERQSKEEIRILAPDVFKTGDTNTRTEDFIANARDFPSVERANALGERHLDPPNEDMRYRTQIVVVRERGDNDVPQEVTDEFAYGDDPEASPEEPETGSFLHFMSDVKGHVDKVAEVKEAGLVWFFVRSDVFIDPQTEPTVARTNVQNRLDEALLAENNLERNIGDDIGESAVVQEVSEVGVVENHHTKLIEYAQTDVTDAEVTIENGNALGRGSFATVTRDFDITPPFKPGTIEIVTLEGDFVATDDANGNLVPAEGETRFKEGTVDYRDPDPQELTSDVSSGTSVTVPVTDAQIFDVGDRVRLSDDLNSEETQVTAVDEDNDTFTADLSNGYQTAENATAEKLWTMELVFERTQTLQSDASSGTSVTVSVEDASQFVAGDVVTFEDDQASEDATVDSVDASNDEIVVDQLSNSYETADGATVTGPFRPNEVFQFQFETEDPRFGENHRDGDIIIEGDQFAVYDETELELGVSLLGVGS